MLFCASSSLLYADQLKQKSRELKALQVKIRQVQQHIRNAEGKRDALEEALQDSDLKINQQQNHLIQLHHQLQQHSGHLTQLKTRYHHLQQRLERQQLQLAKQIQFAYYLGEQKPFKLLLNQQDPAKWQRLVQYHAYLQRARIQAINELQKTIADILANRQAIKAQQQKLNKLENERKQRLQQLRAAKQHNKRVLAKLDKRIHSHSQRMKSLQSNQKSLAKLVDILKHYPTIAGAKPFHTMRHRLPWPTNGQIKPHTDMALQHGVFIKAAAGQGVQSIYTGRVIFADWLRGYGLLLIIQHSSGYLSLYAHNESLFKKLGDTVKAGEIIAKVGHSGGNHESGLYFEIRHHGKPVDPRRWCHRFRV